MAHPSRGRHLMGLPRCVVELPLVGGAVTAQPGVLGGALKTLEDGLVGLREWDAERRDKRISF